MFLLFGICKLFYCFLELRKYAIGTVEKIEIYLGFKKDYKSKYYSGSPFFSLRHWCSKQSLVYYTSNHGRSPWNNMIDIPRWCYSKANKCHDVFFSNSFNKIFTQENVNIQHWFYPISTLFTIWPPCHNCHKRDQNVLGTALNHCHQYYQPHSVIWVKKAAATEKL